MNEQLTNQQFANPALAEVQVDEDMSRSAFIAKGPSRSAPSMA